MSTHARQLRDRPQPGLLYERGRRHSRGGQTRRMSTGDTSGRRPGGDGEMYYYTRRRNAPDPLRTSEPSPSLIAPPYASDYQARPRYPLESRRRSYRGPSRSESLYEPTSTVIALGRVPAYGRDGDRNGSARGNPADRHRSLGPDTRLNGSGNPKKKLPRPPAAGASPLPSSPRRRSLPPPTLDAPDAGHRNRRTKRRHHHSAPSSKPPSLPEEAPSVRSSERRKSEASSGGRDNNNTNNKIWMSAARKAAEAGAAAAVKAHRDDPGAPWTGSKGAKVASTALGAAAVDTFVEHRAPAARGGVRHTVAKEVAKTALGALLENRK